VVDAFASPSPALRVRYFRKSVITSPPPPPPNKRKNVNKHRSERGKKKDHKCGSKRGAHREAGIMARKGERVEGKRDEDGRREKAEAKRWPLCIQGRRRMEGGTAWVDGRAGRRVHPTCIRLRPPRILPFGYALSPPSLPPFPFLSFPFLSFLSSHPTCTVEGGEGGVWLRKPALPAFPPKRASQPSTCRG
jgi:hypothetical protein